MRITPKRLINLALFILVILLMTFIDLPGDSKLTHELQNTGHSIAFGLLAMVALRRLQIAKLFKLKNEFVHYTVIAFMCALVGVVVELLQWVVHRDADVYDVIRDVAGIVAFLGFYSLFDSSVKQKVGKLIDVKTVTSIISAVVFIMALFPLSQLLYVYHQRNLAFPVLVDAKFGWLNKFLTENDAQVQIVPAPDNWLGESGKSVLLVTLYQKQFPGLEIKEPHPDWTGYTNLKLKIFSPNSDEVALTIRIHDKAHNQMHNDRFNKSFRVRHGENVVKIELERVRTAPAHREMNMKEIAGMILFTSKPEKPLRLYIGNIWLDK